MLCRAAMQIVEDVTEGPVVTGLSTRMAKNAEELRGLYNSGRANRDTQVRHCSCSRPAAHFPGFRQHR